MADSPARPQILCISFSNIKRDARVLRQIDVLAELGDVTTAAYGEKPPGATHHLEIDERLPSLPQTPRGVALLALRRYDRAELAAPAMAEFTRVVGDRRYDLIVANEARAMGVAHRVANGAPVIADMHEWAPEERAHVTSWRLLVKPFMTYECAKYLPKMDGILVVNDSIGRMYHERFGVDLQTVRNAGPYHDIRPTEVQEGRIRLVHSGAAVPGRSLETLIEATKRLDQRFSLDLYLVPGRDGGRYLDTIRALIGDDSRITVHPPVRPDQLVKTLNAYDVGIFSLPPLTPNHAYMLPNKIFDFVQARLAVVFNTSPETDKLIDEYSLGAIAPDPSIDALHDTLFALDETQVRAFKANADQAAKVLNSAQDAEVVRSVAGRLLGLKPSDS